MRVPDEYVKLLHRVVGFKAGAMTITKEHGRVVKVEVDGRVLDPQEWQKAAPFHVEQKQPTEKKA